MARISNSQNKTQKPTNSIGSAQDASKAQDKVVEYAEVIDVIMHPQHPDYNIAYHQVVGTIKARPRSKFNADPGNMEWYNPLLANFYSGIPLIGENVILISASGRAGQRSATDQEKYYMPAINVWQDVNENQNPYVTATPQDYLDTETRLCDPSGRYSSNPGIENHSRDLVPPPFGETFEEKDVAPLLKYEGDTALEGRFGQSIRMGSTVTYADISNYWSQEGRNGDAITIISNGHVVPSDSEFHLEDINRDCAVIMFCEGQLIPITTASDIWDTYASNFIKENSIQKSIPFGANKEERRTDDPEINEETPIEETEDVTKEDIKIKEEEETIINTDIEVNDELCSTTVKAIAKTNGKLLADIVNYFVINGATPQGASGLTGNLLAEGGGKLYKTDKGYPEQVCAELEMFTWMDGSTPKTRRKGVTGIKDSKGLKNRGDEDKDKDTTVLHGRMVGYGVGAYETDQGDGKGVGEYTNWSGGVGLAQWTGSRRTRFEKFMIGNLRLHDGGGGPPYGNSSPKPHNRPAYNRALKAATYNCPKTGTRSGIFGQCAYIWHEELVKKYPRAYQAVTEHKYTAVYGESKKYGWMSNVTDEFTSDNKHLNPGGTVNLTDERDIAIVVVADYERPGSYLNRYKSGGSVKWEASKKKRGCYASDCLIVWNTYYGNPSSSKPKNTTNVKEFDLCFGDSIAVGLSSGITGWTRAESPPVTGTAQLSAFGWSREGAAPPEILTNMQTWISNNDLTDKNVLLSSGYSNGPQYTTAIGDQIDALNVAGANVFLLGVSYKFKEWRATVAMMPLTVEPNDVLLDLSKTKNVSKFLGGFDPRSDMVHPLSYSALNKDIIDNRIIE